MYKKVIFFYVGKIMTNILITYLETVRVLETASFSVSEGLPVQHKN